MADKFGKKQSPKGELRRRHRALIDAGLLGRLGSEGRLMACYVLYWADFEKCTLRMSCRGAARGLGVSPTTASRGINQLLEAGVLKLTEKGSNGSRNVYEIALAEQPCAHDPCTERTQGVYGAHTRHVRSAHEVCAPRTPVVYSAHTTGVRITSIPIGFSINTNGGINRDKPAGPCGSEPPDPPSAKEGIA